VFSNVIVGMDGGPHGHDAEALARVLADPGGEVSPVHIDLGARVGSLLPDGATVGAEIVLSEDARTVGEGLHRLAEARAADLLVVGSSRRGMFGRVLLGDDTSASLNGAPCAVAVAPSGFAAADAALATLGVAYDESPESEAALAATRELAARMHAKIRVVEVITWPSYAYAGPMTMPGPPFMDDLLEASALRMAALEGVETSARQGMPGEELAAFGSEVDLLVVGSRSYGPLQRLIHGSTSAYLTRHARCPLLILPRGRVPAREPARMRAGAGPVPVPAAG
jgi:nucleotide-binding universal stress UspA family protein